MSNARSWLLTAECILTAVICILNICIYTHMVPPPPPHGPWFGELCRCSVLCLFCLVDFARGCHMYIDMCAYICNVRKISRSAIRQSLHPSESIGTTLNLFFRNKMKPRI